MVIFRDDDEDDEYYDRSWKLGDPIEDYNGGTMDAHNWYFEDIETYDDKKDLIEKYSNAAKKYYDDYKVEEALKYINLALDLDSNNASNWNIKGVILEDMERYSESEKCYNMALNLFKKPVFYDNKAKMLYSWAAQLLENAKKIPDGTDMLKDAYDKSLKSIRSLPGENSKEKLEKYLRLRDSIKFYTNYERTYQRNLKVLEEFNKYELFTITRMKRYEGVIIGMHKPLKLVKEPDNEFDKDAIAVYAEDKKIGYVANKEYTKFELTSTASELQNKIPDVAQGSYLFYLDRYADIQFHIGKIIF